MFITRSVAFIAYIFVGLVIYWLFTGIVLRLPFFWWKAIFAFLAGVMYVDFEKRISILYLCVAQILLLLLTLTCGFTIRFMAEHLMVAMNGILIIHALRCFPIHSKILTLLGIISYEIYLLHGVFLNEFAMFTGGVYALCVIGATLAVAIVYHAGRMKGLRI